MALNFLYFIIPGKLNNKTELVNPDVLQQNALQLQNLSNQINI